MKNEEKESSVVEQKRSLVWPFILILVGVLLLLNNMGVIPWIVWASLIALWPLILVFPDLRLCQNHQGLRNSPFVLLKFLY